MLSNANKNKKIVSDFSKLIFPFFCKFFIYCIFVFVFWFNWGAIYYNILLTILMNGISIIINLPFNYIADDNLILIIQTISEIRGKKSVINGLSLSVNICPLVALLFATPGSSFKWNLKVVSIAMFLLLITHLIHIYLDSFMNDPNLVLVLKYRLLFPVKYYLFKIGTYLYAFFEQVGRELFPFVIWLFFARKFIPGFDK